MTSLADKVFGSLDALATDLSLNKTGPTLVMGSAPTAVRPNGYRPDWTLICVNGSQAIASQLGLDTPDLVLLRGGLFGQETVDLETQQALRGMRAKTLLARMGNDRSASAERLRALDYSFDRLRKFEDRERNRVIYEAFGSPWRFWLGRKSVSVGAIAVMLAAALGKSPIVITGISFNSAGHFYSRSNLPRYHIRKDRRALRSVAGRGAVLYSTDAAFAGDVGIPVWGD